jgi:formate hydrogenlyase subunit 3/multisubunit Na+/H+ antiporter MnhD subunit
MGARLIHRGGRRRQSAALGILSKAGIFGLVAFLGAAAASGLEANLLYTIIGWFGALTALFATLYACFQEDMKKLLAWSSVGQVGYIVLGLAAMNNMGWTAAAWQTVAHLLFSGLLFLAIAGVILRTGTRNMYETGGLIKKMPATFISVLIGIIALSGVPPLTGFAAKWLLYQALIERGWYLQAGMAFFSSAIAFLYCFRLIHAIFLGQPKPKHDHVKEAPVLMLIPQYILIMGIMLFSTFPGRLIQPASAMASKLFPSPFVWDGFSVSTPLGYLNGTFLMLLVCALFGLMLLFLLLKGPKPRKIGQLNIVFAAERPESPATTHYAWAFFEPYRRAVAPVLKPLVRNFWEGVSEWTVTLGAMLRHIYTGNAQTNILFILIYGIALFFISGGSL